MNENLSATQFARVPSAPPAPHMPSQTYGRQSSPLRAPGQHAARPVDPTHHGWSTQTAAPNH